MNSSQLIGTIVDSIERICSPLADALVTESAFAVFLERFGWSVPPSAFRIEDVQSAVPLLSILSAVEQLHVEINGADEYPSLGTYQSLFAAGRQVVSTVCNLSGSAAPSGIPAGAWSDFTGQVFDVLLSDDLAGRRSALWVVLVLAGVITHETVDAGGNPQRIPFVKKTIDWSGIGTLATDPASQMHTVYGWGDASSSFRFDLVLNRLAMALSRLALPTEVVQPSAELLDRYYPATSPYRSEVRELRVTFMSFNAGESGSSAWRVSILPIPEPSAPNEAPKGLSLGAVTMAPTPPPPAVFAPFSLTLTGVGETSEYDGMRADLLPGKSSVHFQPSAPERVNAALRLESSDNWASKIIFGSDLSHRLQYRSFAVEVGAVGESKSPEVYASVELQNATAVLDTADLDGFLSKSVPASEVGANFSAALVWSSKSGFHLRGSAGAEIGIPLNQNVGPFSLSALNIGASGDASGLGIDVGLSGSFALGPVAASVERIGSRLALVAKEGGASGVFGKLDLDLGFLPPSGLGIAVHSESVSGGGFVSFDRDAGRYSGALELSVYDLAVQAYGLIETKLPDGGYSFLIALSVEFTPAIQLGFGFMLTGIGGLLGINRTVDADVLQKTVKNGSADRILFPKDVVKNGPQIIKDVSALFPSAQGHYVVGPMAKLTWLQLITGKLGLFIELPGPRIVLLGTVQVGLPSPEAAIVKLNVDVAGILDFPKKHLAIGASLRDSVIASYPVSGDMAVRLDWGDKPNFALSVGGLNPAYQAPVGFPKLNRVTVDLAGKGSKPSISLCGYFAITSNTVQLGAKAEIKASGCGISLHGWVEFDALFVLSPFSFIATLDAGVKISFHGYGPTVHLHGELSGPSPYHVKGKVSVSILWWDASLSFSKTFGSGSPAVLPDQTGGEVLKEMVKGVEDLASWSSSLPANAYVPVRLVPNTDPKTRKLDPVGNAVLCQRVAPFERSIAVWKGVKLANPVLLSLYGAKLGGSSGPDLDALKDVQDAFAPGQYFAMTNSQKLSAQPFEKMKAGKVYRCEVATGDSAPEDLRYDEYKLTLGTGRIADPVDGGPPTEAEMEAWSERSDSASSAVRTGTSEKYLAPNQSPNATLDQDVYAIGEAATQKVVSDLRSKPVSKTEALLALGRYCRNAGLDRSKYVVIQTEHKTEV